mmetsp:Transcript_29402/g.47951  ORF Transcript_29402/g.47951 Transcript_29402/m.47951 type:complete len:226 (+) Transcript_29402:1305-1982(+)
MAQVVAVAAVKMYQTQRQVFVVVDRVRRRRIVYMRRGLRSKMAGVPRPRVISARTTRIHPSCCFARTSSGVRAKRKATWSSNIVVKNFARNVWVNMRRLSASTSCFVCRRTADSLSGNARRAPIRASVQRAGADDIQMLAVDHRVHRRATRLATVNRMPKIRSHRIRRTHKSQPQNHSNSRNHNHHRNNNNSHRQCLYSHNHQRSKSLIPHSLSHNLLVYRRCLR